MPKICPVILLRRSAISFPTETNRCVVPRHSQRLHQLRQGICFSQSQGRNHGQP